MQYIEEYKDRFLDELLEMLKILLISVDFVYKDDVMKMVMMVVDLLKVVGVDVVEVMLIEGYLIVYGEKILGEGLLIVLVYGYYDVQLFDFLDFWELLFFEFVIKKIKIYFDGVIFVCGVCDDKG